MTKLGRNDICWCRSGKKYKKCHLTNDQEKASQPKTAGQVFKELYNHYQAKTCMHPEDIHDRIIAAHTIQRNGSLSHIKNHSNKVLTFSPFSQDHGEKLQPIEVGCKKASTFYGFCEKHDKIFAPLENTIFTCSEEQCFLAGYRAICHELYNKERALNFYQSTKLHSDYYQHDAIYGLEIGIKDLKKVKRMYDQALSTKRYHDFEFSVIILNGRQDIVSTGYINTCTDLFGNKLYELTDNKVSIAEGCAVSLINVKFENTDKVSLILSWPKEYKTSSLFAESILRYDTNKLPNAIMQLIFTQIENTFFSEEWWTRLDDKNRTIITRLSNDMPNDFYIDNNIEIPLTWTFDKIFTSIKT